MRNITTSMGIALVLLCLCLAFPTEIPTPSLVKATSFSLEKYTEDNASIVLSVAEKAITQDAGKLSVYVINHSGEYQTYGRIFYLEREENSQWLPVTPLPDTAFEEIGILLPPDKANEEILNIKTYYGRLQPGIYRVVKTFGDTYSSAVFKVKEN